MLRGNTMPSQILVVSGFVGALGLAALVLILQSPRSFERPVWFWSAHANIVAIIGLLSMVVVLSMFSSICMVDVAGGAVAPDSSLALFGLYALFVAFLALMAALPILIFPVSPWAGKAMVAIEIGIIAVYAFVSMHSTKKIPSK